MKPSWFLALIAPAFLANSPAADLYTTDFEAFPVGDNLWADTEGWVSNDTTNGVQGILQDFVTELPLGKTAFLGFDRPAGALTRVFRPVSHDPAATGLPIVEFESFLGVQDSTNSLRDLFSISFYDGGGTFLAAVVFDNTGNEAEMLRWRGLEDDSIESHPTGVPFVRGDQIFGLVALQILGVQINLAANTWSAQLDGIPLFADETFSDPALAPFTLGSTAAEWELGNPVPAFAGDNWLFVADWIVRAAPEPSEPFELQSITRNAAGQTTVTWLGEAGFDYQVLYSDDLMTWRHDDLPNSSYPGIATDGLLSFTDPDSNPDPRYYRVERVPTP